MKAAGKRRRPTKELKVLTQNILLTPDSGRKWPFSALVFMRGRPCGRGVVVRFYFGFLVAMGDYNSQRIRRDT